MAILTNALFIALMSMGILYLAYKVYGGFLVRRVFGFDPSRKTPAEELNDGIDFVPTRKSVLFGHHFASIAGLGPIIGPAIAVYWGWVPALLWVLLGCVLIGGVHDTAALFASLRFKARGIGDLTYEVIGARARMLFLLIIFFLLALAMGMFAIAMAGLFNDLSPQAVVPTFSLILIAMIIGVLVFRFRWSFGKVTIAGILAMMATTYLGMELPVPLYRAFITDDRVKEIIATTDDPDLPQVHGIRATRAGMALHYFEERAKSDETYAPMAENVAQAQAKARSTWVYLLLAYAFFASILPVWLLLQPRDYINCFQLYIGLSVLMLGLLVLRPQIVAPAFGTISGTSDGPPALPLLFITIACGAVSGFHNLVSSGTTARQIRSEADAHFIGYGAMLMEGFLAVLVILACVAGLSRAEFTAQYGSWAMVDKQALGAFLYGAGTIVAQPFRPFFSEAAQPGVIVFCTNFIAVIVVSFAMTTLDSATRLLRFNVEEIGKCFGIRIVQNRYVASLIAVAAIGYFALIKIGGQPAGVVLWQLFGTTNQMLALLGLLVASVLLHKMGKPVIYTLLPMLVMLISVPWAISIKLMEFYAKSLAPAVTRYMEGSIELREFFVQAVREDVGSLSLLIVGVVLAVMAAWMVIEALLVFISPRRLDMAAPSSAAESTG